MKARVLRVGERYVLSRGSDTLQAVLLDVGPTAARFRLLDQDGMELHEPSYAIVGFREIVRPLGRRLRVVSGP